MGKNFYITTTLPYVNADPHIGFALEVIQADVIARYYRLQNYNIFFNTGTDEHGLKIFRKAKEKNLKPKAYCDVYAERFKSLKKTLNLSYNSFVRTTDSNHIEAAQEFWQRCSKNKDIYKKNYKIKYCVGCELEKTESELLGGKCPTHPNQEIEIIEEENYFFRYSKYQKRLLDFYEKNPSFVFPQSRFNEIKEFTRQGLKDFSVSRLKEKMPWGIPVPGDSDHVFFVWFDALISYISALGWPKESQRFNDFWPGLQVAGKDNLRQQSSMWQAMLMSAGLPNSRQIFIHGFITSSGQKMSKSLGNVIDPFELVEKYGTDPVRYFLLREIPSTEDGDFTYEKFEQRYNSDLANGLGNLVSRIAKLCQGKRISISSKRLSVSKKISSFVEQYNLNGALVSIWQKIAQINRTIDRKQPWKMPEQELVGFLEKAIEEIQQIAFDLQPFLPETSEKIFKQINLVKEKKQKSQMLFPRLK